MTVQAPLRWLVLAITILTLAVTPTSHAAGAGTPRPAFARLDVPFASFAAVTDELEGGARGQITVRVARQSTCALTLSGPHRMHAGPYPAAMQQTFGTWLWTVPAGVRGGVWRGTVACRSGKHLRKVLRTRLLVAASRSNSAALVAKGSMIVAVAASPPQPTQVAPQEGGGKGGGGYPNDDALCKWTGQRSGRCADYDWGYRAGAAWSLLSSRGFYYRNCTDFAAWYLGLRWSDFRFPGNDGNARSWKAAAGNVGLEVTSTPHVGDVAWWGRSRGGGYGHVAIVMAVDAGGTVTTADYNGDGLGNYTVRPNVRAEAYLHKPVATPPPPPSPPAPTPPPPTPPAPTPPPPIPSPPPPPPPPPTPTPDTTPPSVPGGLSASGQTQSSIALTWAPSSDNVGVAGYKVFVNGAQAATTGSTSYSVGGLSCGSAYTLGVAAYDAGGNASATTNVKFSTAACPPPPSPTYAETTGGAANTWTNYTNAGGAQGPTIPAFATVQIACKVTGFRVADGNTWWYRIAQSPWNNTFYVSADAFYNNGSTSGPLKGTPFVDPKVRDC